jgi:cobalamin biosynthetic protein CobC
MAKDSKPIRDHGGGIDAAISRFGGDKADWIDLSTGINPRSYPLPSFSNELWTRLPDASLFQDFERAARSFWRVPPAAKIVPAGGASAIISALPSVFGAGTYDVAQPTYNEHEAAYVSAGWNAEATKPTTTPTVRVLVNPNNPDGRTWKSSDFNIGGITVVDESFCDTNPALSHIASTAESGTLVIKSFGKFWGLAGLRFGCAIAHPDTLGSLADRLGPWAVSGPALVTATAALKDEDWASENRLWLNTQAQRLTDLFAASGIPDIGGTSVFRLFEVDNAAQAFEVFAQNRILTRIFPYSDRWIRVGLPNGPDAWSRLSQTLRSFK